MKLNRAGAAQASPERADRRQALFWLTLTALGLLAFGLRASSRPTPIDDAFITFRYVENINDGYGFVYNLGERLLGTSTPLYTLFLVLLRRLGVSDLPSAALFIGSVADGITAILLALMALKLSGSRVAAFSVALAWAVSVPSITFARSGMETSLFILTITLAFYALLMRSPLPAAFFSSLSVLVRPDGMLVLFLVIIAVFTLYRRKILGTVLISAITITPWLVFSTAYFGNPLPHSALVKASGDILPQLVIRKLFIDLPVTFFLGGAIVQLVGTFAPFVAGAIILVSALFFLFQYVSSSHYHRRWLLIGAYPALYVLALLVRQIYAFPWYLVPPLSIMFLGVITGAYLCLPRYGLVVAGLLIASNAGALFVHGNFWMLEQQMDQRMIDYSMASSIIENLMDSFEGESTVAVTEVGIIGYRLRPVTMLDLAGLVSDNRIPWSRLVTPVEVESPEFVVGIESQLGFYIEQYPNFGPFLRDHYYIAWQQLNSFDQNVVIYCRADIYDICQDPNL